MQHWRTLFMQSCNWMHVLLSILTILTNPSQTFSTSIAWHKHTLDIPDSNVHVANMGPTWVMSAPDGPHDGPMNLLSGMSCFILLWLYRNPLEDPWHSFTLTYVIHGYFNVGNGAFLWLYRRDSPVFGAIFHIMDLSTCTDHSREHMHYALKKFDISIRFSPVCALEIGETYSQVPAHYGTGTCL